MEMNDNRKVMKLSEILDKNDLDIVYHLIKKNQWKELREFLNTIQSKLTPKNILADYLYYFLEYRFKQMKGGMLKDESKS